MCGFSFLISYKLTNMFQNNPLLAQLKQKIHDAKPKVEGIVRATDKAYGFLECEKERFFIPPMAMKKLTHGDKILAFIETIGEKQQAEPETLLEPMLTRFIAKVHFNKDNKLQVFVDHPQIKFPMGAKTAKDLTQALQEGDWVVAQLTTHPLRDDRFFFAEIQAFICHQTDEFAPWWVTLAKYEQSRYPVDGQETYTLLDTQARQDFTHLHFVTIDSESTQDMDDALFIEPTSGETGEQTGWKLWVAIADPTAYIAEDSQIERSAKTRCFTQYLPAFNVPMLPRELADDLCSLKAKETKAVLLCTIETDLNGNQVGKPEFCVGYIQSQAKLAYDKVSDYLENKANAWQPEDETTQTQIEYLYRFTQARTQWRQRNALRFKESPDYEFQLAENGKVIAVHAHQRRIANQIVEEAMILANMCAGEFLNEHIGGGIFNTHMGFDKKFLTSVKTFLINQLPQENAKDMAEKYHEAKLATLEGYCQMRRDVSHLNSDYLEMRLRRFLTFAEFKASLAPHFGLGIKAYATWTSPIRKYGDMVNHRLIKAFLRGERTFNIPEESLLQHLQEARRKNRLVERDIADWLYCRYLAEKVAEKPIFSALICDISRGGMRVQLIENGAQVFIPASQITPNREDYQPNVDEMALYIKGECRYKLGDKIQVQLLEVREETRSIVGTLVL